MSSSWRGVWFSFSGNVQDAARDHNEYPKVRGHANKVALLIQHYLGLDLPEVYSRGLGLPVRTQTW